MSAKLARRQGLARIRKLQEEMERAALERAAYAVAQVESALRLDEAAVADSGRMSRAALDSGDRFDWLLADAQGEVARANHSKLSTLLLQRQAEVVPARASFLLRRKEHEQARALAENALLEGTAAETRCAQAEADDWVLSRWERGGKVKAS